jgi:hypothetical protein
LNDRILAHILVRGSSRANRAAVEALETPAETGEDLHVERRSLSRSKRPQREVVLSTVNIGPLHNLIRVITPDTSAPAYGSLTDLMGGRVITCC